MSFTHSKHHIMKVQLSFFLLLLALACSKAIKPVENTSDHANHQASTPNSGSKLSPNREAMADVGGAHIHISYGSPSVRGRVIWGGLIAYDQVWATGAHQATSIDFSTDVEILGQKIPKGKYGFFTIPSKDKWLLIINKNWDQHLADEYDSKDDLIRIQVSPETLPETQESLTYSITPIDKKHGTIEIRWEKIKIGFGFKVR